MSNVRIGVPGGGCVMCVFPTQVLRAKNDDHITHAFAAGLAIAAEVKGDIEAIDLCEAHRRIVAMHETYRRERAAIRVDVIQAPLRQSAAGAASAPTEEAPAAPAPAEPAAPKGERVITQSGKHPKQSF